MKLRGGTAELRIETGRWCGLRRDERICTMCDSGEVEDVDHFLLHCTGLVEERMEMERLMKETVEGWQEMEGKAKVVWVIDQIDVRMEGFEDKWRGCTENNWTE